MNYFFLEINSPSILNANTLADNSINKYRNTYFLLPIFIIFSLLSFIHKIYFILIIIYSIFFIWLHIISFQKELI